MRKRILSFMLAVVMCFSVIGVVAVADDDATLFAGSTIGELLLNYRDRVWDWQTNQFDAMTGEQLDVVEAILPAYYANEGSVKAITEAVVDELVTDAVLANASIKDLYKWKLMRDIMEGKLDVTSTDARYTDWLNRFTAFEQANDEAISASAPIKALNGLGDYSAELTEYFKELVLLVYDQTESITLTGNDADKALCYIDAALVEFDPVVSGDLGIVVDTAAFNAYALDDVKDLIMEGMFDNFVLGLKIATGEINKSNTDGVLDKISDRNFKGSFLLLGETNARELIDIAPSVRQELVNMDKEELVKSIAQSNAAKLLSGNNEQAADAIYNVMIAVSEYIVTSGKVDAVIAIVEQATGVDFDVKVTSNEDGWKYTDASDVIVRLVKAAKESMEVLDPNHGFELVHMNTYLGREMLRYNNNGNWDYLAGAVIDGKATNMIHLGYAHTRYPVFENVLSNGTLKLAQFDVDGGAEGINVYCDVDNGDIGDVIVDVADDANGAAVITVYRGYHHQGGAKDVYRYVTQFTVKAESVTEVPYVKIDKIADVEADGQITVKGNTNLDYVTIAILKDGKNVFVGVCSRIELAEGVVINVPNNAEVGDVYTVVVGTDKASDTTAFAIKGADVQDTVVLDPIANTTVNGQITVKGTTTLDYVTVTILKDGKNVFLEVCSRIELAEGIEINVPNNAEVGDVYTVVVGTDKASDYTAFVIIPEDEKPATLTLDAIAPVKADGKIVVKGTTSLDYLVVAIVKDGKNVFVGVYTKAEYEAGIEINVPNNAQNGDVYEVAVGTNKISTKTTFVVKDDETVDFVITLDNIADVKGGEQITVKGTSDYNSIPVKVTDANGNVVDGSGTYTKAEYEAGIQITVPADAVAETVYTVTVGPADDEQTTTFTITGFVELDTVADAKAGEAVTVKGTTNYAEVPVKVTDANGNEVAGSGTYTKAEYEAGIQITVPAGAQPGDVYTVTVGLAGKEQTTSFTVQGDTPVVYEITLDDVADVYVGEKITVKGTTNYNNVPVKVLDSEGNLVAGVVNVTKAEYEAGVQIALPEGVAVGNDYEVVVGPAGNEKSDKFNVLKPEGSLALAGGATRYVALNGTEEITVTPQNIKPEGANVEIVWTIDNTILKVVVDAGNTIKLEKIATGTTDVVATLKVNGIEVASQTVTIYDESTSGPTGGGYSRPNPTTKLDVALGETTESTVVFDADKHKNVVEYELIKVSGDGEVRLVEVVDGKPKFEGVKEGTVIVKINGLNKNGRVVVTEMFEITVLHRCEWSDLHVEGKDLHWAHKTIDIMTINGYINGYPDDTFKPDEYITRAEFSAIVYRILGLENADDGVIYDDTKGHWAEGIIGTMSLPEGYGMLRGYGDGTFGPEDNITREQAIAIIARAKSAVWVEAVEGAKDVFTDADKISSWFDAEMDAAVTNKLITGYDDGSYKPLNFTTRAEACTLLSRAWPEILETK